MKSNIIKAAINLGCIPGNNIFDFYKEIGRDCEDVNGAAFDYILDVFAGTVREENAAAREKKLKMTFDPDAEDYPDGRRSSERRLYALRRAVQGACGRRH